LLPEPHPAVPSPSTSPSTSIAEGHPLGQGGRGHRAQPHAVQPQELLHVEHRAAQADAIERELADEIGEFEDLALVRHGVPEQRQEVAPDRVRVLAEACERADEIDVERAQAKQEEALRRLDTVHPADGEAYNVVAASLRKAETRIRVAGAAHR